MAPAFKERSALPLRGRPVKYQELIAIEGSGNEMLLCGSVEEELPESEFNKLFCSINCKYMLEKGKGFPLPFFIHSMDPGGFLFIHSFVHSFDVHY